MINNTGAYTDKHLPRSWELTAEPMYLVIDLFCGAGGVTTGFAEAQLNGNSFVKVIACINHDHLAIKSHWANHPEVIHFEEDIRTLELSGLVETVDYWRSVYPKALVILWGSLECTNYSKAKGGKEKDADSRTLMYALYKHWNNEGYGKGSYVDGKSYIQYLNPDYIMIENVVEFKTKNDDFIPWCKEINTFGYRNEWAYLNSADFGAYTSRERLFGCFAKDGLPIIFPQPTHAKRIGASKKNLLFTESLQPWKAVKEVLNFDDEGKSIFNRKKPLVEATLARIYAGLVKFVANGDTSFIAKYYSGRPAGKVTSSESPLGTITTAGNQSLIEAVRFIDNQYGRGYASSTEQPLSTQTTKPRHSIVEVQKYAATQIQSVEQPAGAIMTTDKHSIVTITTDNFIVNPSFPKNPKRGLHSTDKPAPVIVAGQKKAPLRMITVEQGAVQMPIYDTDSEIMIKIKEFMVIYGIVDIKMRMLRVQELKIIQGFPSTYILDGTQEDQKKFIGNSVVPQVVKSWIEAMAQATTPAILLTYKQAA